MLEDPGLNFPLLVAGAVFIAALYIFGLRLIPSAPPRRDTVELRRLTAALHRVEAELKINTRAARDLVAQLKGEAHAGNGSHSQRPRGTHL